MRTIIVCMAIVVTLALIGVSLLAQEIVPTPDPIGGRNLMRVPAPTCASPFHPVRRPMPPPLQAQIAGATAGMTVVGGTGRRRNAGCGTATTGAGWSSTETTSPCDQSGDVQPPPGYWSGYYPGTAVGVGPYGNVNVDVGRRVSVDVAGTHGTVRVGRLCIGW